MTKKCKECKTCRVDLEVLEEFEETSVDFPKIASYLGGTITKEEGDYNIHLGKENAGFLIEKHMELISVLVMRSKKFFVSLHQIMGVDKVKFSTVLAPRGKTKQEVRDVVFQNKKGGIIIHKERGNDYNVVSVINIKEAGG